MTTERPRLGLRQLADLYEAVLKVRNQCENRLRAVDQGFDDADEESQIANYPLLARLNDSLEQAQTDMEDVLPQHPIYDWLMGIPGINRTLGCRVLGMIPMETEEDFPTFSRLRVFCGLCPGRNKLVKGEKACYNRRLKTSLYVAFGNMLKAQAVVGESENAPRKWYGDIYTQWRKIYAHRHGVGESGAEWLYKAGVWTEGDPPIKIHGVDWKWEKRLKCPKCGKAQWVPSLSTAPCKDCEKGTIENADDWEHGMLIGPKIEMWRFHICKKATVAMPGPKFREWREAADLSIERCAKILSMNADGESVANVEMLANLLAGRESKKTGRICVSELKRICAATEQTLPDKYLKALKDNLAAPEWPDLRQHFGSKNKLLDVFVSHCWIKWRTAMGWSTRSLYVHDKLGHHMQYEPDDYSSKTMAKKKSKR
jgi:transcriptional regulator with XRE-family HTH domain